MSKTTYSRTSGARILPPTWTVIRNRYPLLDGQVLHPDERCQYDALDEKGRDEFVRTAAAMGFQIPEDMRFARDEKWKSGKDYPGAVPEHEGHKEDAELNAPKERAAEKLGISVNELDKALRNFTGAVILSALPEGIEIYRTIGLFAEKRTLENGILTNHPLGSYFEPGAPNRYKNLIEFYQKTAVLQEWNGDEYHVVFTLKRKVYVLTGSAKMQSVGDGMVMPGGATQYYIPNLTLDDVQESLFYERLTKTQFTDYTEAEAK